MELWMDIKEFKNYYQVSNLGRIRSLDRFVIANKYGGLKLLKGKIMKLTKTKGRNNKYGYLVVNLRKQGFNKVCFIHSSVAKAFIENKNNLPTVNHKDGNKLNNNVDNLEWNTYSENNQHALNNNLRSPRGRKIIQYDLNMNEIYRYKSVAEASIKTGIGRCSISNCLNNRCLHTNSFIWKYE
jgi:hypothetical protein